MGAFLIKNQKLIFGLKRPSIFLEVREGWEKARSAQEIREGDERKKIFRFVMSDHDIKKFRKIFEMVQLNRYLLTLRANTLQHLKLI
tara:strand:+ start:348 stop:608 length:261 start_codon:yes stop_codon:yes gene_type:complete